MSCEEFEQNIYVYEELSVSEKTLLDTHLQTCHSCALLFEEVIGAKRLVRKLADKEIIPPNAARLTGGVMSRVASLRQKPAYSLIDLFLIPTRLAFTVVSIALLIGFAFEFLRDNQSYKMLNVYSRGSVVLSAKLLGENLSQRKTQHSLFADCRSPLKPAQIDLNCVKSKLK